jgi:hypothetical protein
MPARNARMGCPTLAAATHTSFSKNLVTQLHANNHGVDMHQFSFAAVVWSMLCSAVTALRSPIQDVTFEKDEHDGVYRVFCSQREGIRFALA